MANKPGRPGGRGATVAKARGAAKRSLKEVVEDHEALLHGYEEVYLECRDLRHPWAVQGYFSEAGQIKRRLSCGRCGTTRTDIWDPSGGRIGGRYQYPEGYTQKGVGQIAPVEIRREVLSRVKVYASEENMVQSLFKAGSGNGAARRSQPLRARQAATA